MQFSTNSLELGIYLLIDFIKCKVIKLIFKVIKFYFIVIKLVDNTIKFPILFIKI